MNKDRPSVASSKPLLHNNMQVSQISTNSAYKAKLLYLAADVFCFFLLTTPLWLFNLTSLVSGTKRGFYCNDDTIKYPFRNNTVSSIALFVFGVFATVITMIVIETIHFRKRRRQRGFYHPLALLLYRSIGYFVVGASVNQVLTDILKLSVGRLRPHFMDVCLPDIDCTLEKNFHIYFENISCSRTSFPGKTDAEFHEMNQDMRKSFISGHASFALYVAVFYVFYLEIRSHWHKIQLLRHLFQIAAIGLAFWTCCTRIIDHKHHPEDVLLGGLLGTVLALLFIQLFKKSVIYRKPEGEGKPHEILTMTATNGSHRNASVDVERRDTHAATIDINGVSAAVINEKQS